MLGCVQASKGMPWSLLSKESQTYRFPCLEAWRLPSQGSRLFELFASNELTPLEAPAPDSTAAAHALTACQEPDISNSA